MNDLDAHCIEPDGNHIWFKNKGRTHSSSGILDVDIIDPVAGKPAVENITWSDIKRMQSGEYQFFVHNYTHRGGKGFSAEIEYDGQIHSYEYEEELAQSKRVTVAKIKFSMQDGVEFVYSLPSSTSQKTAWGLTTNRFHPVSMFLLSPNHWGEVGVGIKHYMFMLADCVNDTQPNGFYNEFLRNDLMKQKRVFAALGRKMAVSPSDNQLSGVGFSSTIQNSVVLRVDGKKLVKVVF
jgi:hypothetical protein